MRILAIWIVIIIFSIASSVSAQNNKQVEITLKNGTKITGTIKQFDPANSITIDVVGFTNTIKMSDVDKVEPLVDKIGSILDNGNSSLNIQQGQIPSLSNPLIVKDTAQYPDNIKIMIGNREFTFLLVRGGSFLMGYDGRGSRTMDSEPIHLVHVTSFYMCSELLSDAFVNGLNISGISPRIQEEPFIENDRDDIAKIVNKCNTLSSKQFRLPTEAEWEYAARGPLKNIFMASTESEACSDYFAEYTELVETDPTGPKKGRRHVVRHPYCKDQYLPFDRSNLYVTRSVWSMSPIDNAAVRLTIKAKDLLNK